MWAKGEHPLCQVSAGEGDAIDRELLSKKYRGLAARSLLNDVISFAFAPRHYLQLIRHDLCSVEGNRKHCLDKIGLAERRN
jgi:hypothetical protein